MFISTSLNPRAHATGALVFVVSLAATVLSYSQTVPASPPAFEVASIKPTDPAFTLRSIQIPPGDGMVTLRGLTLKELIQYAWGHVEVGTGLHANMVSGQPGWFDHNRYDIVAKTEGLRIPSRDERKQMLRTLLVERFQLKFHRELRVTAVYALIVGKNGHRMKVRKPDDGGPPFHLPMTPHSISGRSVSMPQLADALQAIIPLTDPERDDRPIVDRTSLSGDFDFDLTWSGDPTLSGGRSGASADAINLPDLFMAVQEQLGLKLEAQKLPIEIIVIDHAERPSEN